MSPPSTPRGGVSVGAAADIGSNSLHLLVAVVGSHRLEPLLDESVLLGMGAAIDSAGFLGSVGRAGLASAVVRYAEAAQRMGAGSLTLIGTEPLRRAFDAPGILAAVKGASGLPVFVLAHEEEGELTLLGVTLGRRVTSELAVVDVGGGSTELVLVGPDRAPHTTGLAIGSTRLTTRLVAHNPPLASEIAALRAEARARLAAAPIGRPRRMIAVGGTASNLLRVLPAAALDRLLTRRRLAEALDVLASEPFEEAAARHAVNLTRARTLPAGAAILEAVLERYELDRLHVSEEGIREGTILAVARGGVAWRDRLPELALGWGR